MVKLMSTKLASLAAVLYSVACAQKTLCPANYDICGWTLTGTYGYAQSDLVVAAADGGVGISAAYDSIYNCDENGEISWSQQCNAGSCNAGIDGRTDAVCKGSSGSSDQGDDGGDSSDGGDGSGNDNGNDSESGNGSNNNGNGNGNDNGDSGSGDAADSASQTQTFDAPLTTLVTTIITRPQPTP